MLSPPLDMKEKWFAPHTGLFDGQVRHEPRRARPRRRDCAGGIAVNALWPRTTIATAAIRNLLGGEALMRRSRTPEILADCAYRDLPQAASSFTGNFLIDDTFLAGEGVTDFEQYRVDPVGAAGAGLLRAGRAIRRRRASCSASRRWASHDDASRQPSGLCAPRDAARPSRTGRPDPGRRAGAGQSGLRSLDPPAGAEAALEAIERCHPGRLCRDAAQAQPA